MTEAQLLVSVNCKLHSLIPSAIQPTTQGCNIQIKSVVYIYVCVCVYM